MCVCARAPRTEWVHVCVCVCLCVCARAPRTEWVHEQNLHAYRDEHQVRAHTAPSCAQAGICTPRLAGAHHTHTVLIAGTSPSTRMSTVTHRWSFGRFPLSGTQCPLSIIRGLACRHLRNPAYQAHSQVNMHACGLLPSTHKCMRRHFSSTHKCMRRHFSSTHKCMRRHFLISNLKSRLTDAPCPLYPVPSQSQDTSEAEGRHSAPMHTPPVPALPTACRVH